MTSNEFAGLGGVSPARRRVRANEPAAVQQPAAVRQNDIFRKTTLDTIKLLGFAQIVLTLCAGAIPSPFRFLAFLPGLALLGTAIFQGTWLLVRSLHTHGAFASAPPSAETSTESRSPEVVSITRIA